MSSSNYENGEILLRPFDFETHKKTFTNYCEVVILEDGTIEYATPSHEQKLLAVTASKFNMDPKDIIYLTCGKFAIYWYEILSFNSKCMQVSNESCRFFFEPNEKQVASLRKLVEHGLVDISVFECFDANVRSFEAFKEKNPAFDEIACFFDK